MWRGHLRAELGRIELKTLALGVIIGLKKMTGCYLRIRHPNRFQILHGDLIGCNQTYLRTHLRAHVGQGHALLHAQAAHSVACKFNSLVIATVHAELANHVQHHVFGTDPFLQRA